MNETLNEFRIDESCKDELCNEWMQINAQKSYFFHKVRMKLQSCVNSVYERHGVWMSKCVFIQCRYSF